MLALRDPVSERDKPWGCNRHLLYLPNLELHHASILPGGYSSIHVHRSKVNHFYVTKGELTVEIFDTHEPMMKKQVLTLLEGQQLIVPAGTRHRFVNQSRDTVQLIETYWAALDHDDIVRDDVGGIQQSGGGQLA